VNLSLANSLASLPDSDRQAWLANLTDAEAAALKYEWRFWARPNQIPPPDDEDWFIWLAKPGRGWGKTRAGAEWVRMRVESGRAKQLAFVNDTARDTRSLMVEGPDGIIALSPPWCKPKYEPTKARVAWPSGGPWEGAVAYLYAAESPEMLRGPQHDTAWCDELAKWQNLRKVDQEGGTAFENLMLGLRIGNPKCAVTTTPRGVKTIRELVKRQGVIVVNGTSYDNRANLSDEWFRQVITPLEHTRLGRQEVFGDLLDDVPGALWTRAMIDAALEPRAVPTMKRVVVAIDPAVTATEQSDETGIVVAGLGTDNHGYVLADESGKYSPEQWARKASQLYHLQRADRIVAETNNGGDMVGYTLRSVDKTASFKALTASRGKRTRAEPVAALYEQGLVHHVSGFPMLEDQLCTWDANGSEKSPDRLDALVWALTELMLERTQAVASVSVDTSWQRDRWR
jgi:phage terminase large subunit-like protein